MPRRRPTLRRVPCSLLRCGAVRAADGVGRWGFEIESSRGRRRAVLPPSLSLCSALLCFVLCRLNSQGLFLLVAKKIKNQRVEGRWQRSSGFGWSGGGGVKREGKMREAPLFRIFFSRQTCRLSPLKCLPDAQSSSSSSSSGKRACSGACFSDDTLF